MPPSPSPRRAALLALAALLLAAPAELRAQAAPATPAMPASAAQAITVYLDCPFFICDLDFVRTEVAYVNWVRDRTDADVHVLVTTQTTGGGGTEHTLAFIGRRAFAGTADTLRFVTEAASTPDERRQGLVRTLGLGLARFVARTPLAPRLTLTYRAPAGDAGRKATTGQAARDRWNYWVFSTSFSGNKQKEASYSSQFFSGNVSARRTTQDWKINLPAREFYSEDRFQYGSTSVTSIRRSYEFSPLVVRSLGPRLSAGFRGGVGSSSRENKRLYYRATPAVEYDVFPYTESTRRMLTLQYAIGVEGFRYDEETIYFKTEETRPVHSLNARLTQNQPWGSVNVFAEGGHYLDDHRQNYAAVGGNTNVRLFKGFSFNLGGNYSAIHNQLFLPRKGATPEEVLTQQRQLQTNYRYFLFFGLNYTFGSTFNNIVNPRFGRDGGGETFIFF